MSPAYKILMTAFERGWSVLKAVEFTPWFEGERPFHAYRAIPTSALDEVLSEGIVPRLMPKSYVRPHSDSWKGDKAIYTFRHNPYNRAAQRDSWESSGFVPGNDPLLQAQFFADVQGIRGMGPMSIVGSRVKPPGRAWVDPDFEPQVGFRAMMSARPIEGRHLEEVIPILDDGREIRYMRGGPSPDAILHDIENAFPRPLAPRRIDPVMPTFDDLWGDDDDDLFSDNDDLFA